MVAAYDAPFPDQSYTEGARQFPTLVPISPDDPASRANREAWTVLERWESRSSPPSATGIRSLRAPNSALQARIPGAKGQSHVTIEGGGHFLQEDRGPELAKVVVDFVEAT